jgi:hypothetical protein
VAFDVPKRLLDRKVCALRTTGAKVRSPTPNRTETDFGAEDVKS